MTAGPDRDRALDALLRREMGRDSAAGSGPCLDADTLAAWFDGGLDDPARATAVAHAAGCARCQAMLGVIAQTQPAVVAAQPWWRRQWTWLVPLTAGAAAVTLWTIVPAQRSAPFVAPTADGSQVARQEAAPAAPTAPTAPGVGSRESGVGSRESGVGSRESGAGGREPGAPGRTLSAPTADAAAKPQPTTSERRQDFAVPPREETFARDRVVAPPTDLKADPRAAEPPKTDDRLADARKDEDQRAKRELDAQTEAQVRFREAPPPVASVPAAPAPAAAPVATPTAARPAAAGPAKEEAVGRMNQSVVDSDANRVDIVSPDPAIRWRVGPRGTVLLSTNGGKTWQPLSSGITTDLLAGSASSATVCWLVGRAGTVLLTTDGRTWQQRTAPAAVDLVAVQAVDAQLAIVTARDGRRFETRDAGRTWRAP